MFVGHGGPVTSVSFTPDGKHVISCGGEGDSSIRLWDPKTGECKLTLAGPPFHENGTDCFYHIALYTIFEPFC